jgi:hypothetical protein
MDAGQFGVRAGGPVDKPRNPPANFASTDARKARKRGAPLFGYFLSGKREKVTRPPQEGESSPLQITINSQSIATEVAPTKEQTPG